MSLSPKQAIALQHKLKEKIKLQGFNKNLNIIAGADVSFNKYSPTIYAGFVVLEFSSLQVIESASAIMDVRFPYIPGLLSFRELPPLLEAWKKLKSKPQVVVFDGHGIAHPRRLGIASHAGLIINRPTIGCAKNLLTGVYKEPKIVAGASEPLLDRKTQEQIGSVLRTKNKVKPVFVSPGHRMDFESALRILKHCCCKHRIPEPTRLAHLFVNEVRKKHQLTL